MEILNTTIVFNHWYVGVAATVLLFTTIVFLGKSIGNLFNKKFRKSLVLFLVSIVGILLLNLIAYFKPFVNEHEVVLRDGATIDASKYTIESQRGKIIVIREIEEVN